MVKISNVFGDITTGKHGMAVYQRKYGRGMRRLYKEVKPSQSVAQLNQQKSFKDAIAWVKSLSFHEKNAIKAYCKRNKVGFREGEPIHWYNWAKSLGMTRPKFAVINSETGKYKVAHPSLLKIEEISVQGDVLFSVDELSDVLEDRYQSVFQQTPSDGVSLVRVTTLPGMVYDYSPLGLSPSVVTSCYPWFRSVCLEVRAIDRDIIKDNCWQLTGDEKHHAISTHAEYGHVL